MPIIWGSSWQCNGNAAAQQLDAYAHCFALPWHNPQQADLDLGNYERFLDISLSKDNNLTTGKCCRCCSGSTPLTLYTYMLPPAVLCRCCRRCRSTSL